MPRPDASQRLAATKPKDGPSRGLIGGIIAAVIVVIVVVAVFVTQANKSGSYSGPVPTGGTSDAKGLRAYPSVKLKSNAPTVDIYEDFQCPICKDFEAQTGDTVKGLYQNNTARVKYHTVAFLNRFSTTKYSTRSANAAACTADSKVFPAFHDQLFQGQPAEGSAGLTDDQLIELARGVGATEHAFADCVSGGKYKDWVNAVTDTASRNGVTGTPTVLVNGKQILEQDGAPPSPDTLLGAVQAAAK